MRRVIFCLFAFSDVIAATEGTHKPEILAVHSDIHELLLEIRINQQNLRESALLLKTKNALLADGDDIKRWRFRLPEHSTFSYQGHTYYDLNALEGVSYRIDEATQSLMIDAKSDALTASQVQSPVKAFSEPDPLTPGAFINYEAVAQTSPLRSFQLDGTMELSLFNQWGVAVNNVLLKDLGESPRLIRLDSTWTLDKPSRASSLRFGDAISNAGTWGKPVRFGGLQWSTNFNTQPGFITFPSLNVSGEAVLPSTVDVFVENNKLLSQPVAPGPFTINNLHGITGLHDMRLVVRDLFGREQVITQPYYASQQLLKPALQEFSYELGMVREHFGIDSNDYGRWLAIGTHRYGFNDRFTGEWHGELLQNQQSFGLGGGFLLPTLGVFDAAIAGSHSRKGEGFLLALGFQRQTSALSFGGRIQFASSDFTQVGLSQDRLAPKLQSTFHLGYATKGAGNFNISHIFQEYRDQDSVNLLSANYNYTFSGGSFLNMSAFKSLSDENNQGVSLSFSHALGERTNVNLSAGIQNNDLNSFAQAQRNLPFGSGMGYRLLVGHDRSERLEGGLYLQNDIGTYRLDTSWMQQQYAMRGSASGGVALMGGDAFFSRRLNSSFAVVQVSDYPNVRIYAENQHVATTDTSGSALVPALRPYQENHIRIEQADLPLDVEIESLEMKAKPYFRSGTLLKFPVRRSRGAVLMIVLDDGKPVPAGAIAQVVGQKEEFPVATHGQLYITGLDRDNQLRVIWNQKSCMIPISLPKTKDPLPNLGTFVCHGVLR